MVENDGTFEGYAPGQHPNPFAMAWVVKLPYRVRGFAQVAPDMTLCECNLAVEVIADREYSRREVANRIYNMHPDLALNGIHIEIEMTMDLGINLGEEDKG